jgi:hypothetical protein
VSSRIEKILYDWLREHSHLPDASSGGGEPGESDKASGERRPSSEETSSAPEQAGSDPALREQGAR